MCKEVTGAGFLKHTKKLAFLKDVLKESQQHSVWSQSQGGCGSYSEA